MTPTIRHAALAALAAATLSGTAAWAQQDDHRGPPADMRARMQAQMQGVREAHERQQAQDLRTILRLRPDQEGALAAYLQSHRPPEGPGFGPRPPMAPAPMTTSPMTTPQRLDEMARREAEHAAMRQTQAQALRTFYAALSAEQRQVFDALQRLRGGGPEHGGPEHGGYEPGGWGGHRGFGGRMGDHDGPPPPRDD